MKRRPSGPHRREDRPLKVRQGPLSSRAVLAKLTADPDYLAFKERLGEPLTPSERAILDAHRAGGGG